MRRTSPQSTVPRFYSLLAAISLLVLAGAGCRSEESEPEVASGRDRAETTTPSDTDSTSQPPAPEPGDDESEGAAESGERTGNSTGSERSPEGPPQPLPPDDPSGGRPEETRDPRLPPADQEVPRPDPPPSDVAGETGTPRSAVEREPAIEPPRREPLFVDWPDPTVAVLVTGRQHGYIEPCGCTGLENALGGMARRYSLWDELQRDRGWTVVPVDAGNQVRRYGRQPEIKFATTMSALQRMQYQAVAFGPDDLRLPAGDLASYALGTGDEPGPFVSSNVTLFFDPSFTPTFRTVEANGIKLAVTTVLGDTARRQVNNSEVQVREAEEGLAETWPQMESAEADVYILVAHASLEESRELARQFPGFDLVVTAGGAGEPTLEPESIEGTDAKMVQVGIKGMFAGVIGIYDEDGSPRFRYQRIPLDNRLPDSPEMLELLLAYQQQLKHAGLSGLGLEPTPHPRGAFVGSEKCSECHDVEYDIWKNGRDGYPGYHAHATESIAYPTERSEIERHYDPECLSCHVTGWHPQRYFPYESGYLSLDETPRLIGNGCENCHGPGGRHVAIQEGELDVSKEEAEADLDMMRMSLDTAERVCLECHDLDNSPDFEFQEYWQRIRHGEDSAAAVTEPEERPGTVARRHSLSGWFLFTATVAAFSRRRRNRRPDHGARGPTGPGDRRPSVV